MTGATTQNGNHDGRRRGGRWRLVVWGTAAFLLLLPLLAMQVSSEMNWDETDFIVWGVMLAIAAGICELGARMSGNRAYRGAVAIAVIGGFLLTWINLAVGVIGNEDNPLNLMFGGVLLVGVIGAVIVRLRPEGMAWAMLAMASAQAVIAVVALFAGYFTLPLNAFFATVWLVSAALFRRSAGEGG